MPAPEIAAVSVAVALLWRGDAIAGRRLVKQGSITVGAAADTLAPIPCAPAECDAFEVARLEGAAAFARIPAGAIGSLRGAAGSFSIVFGPTEVRLARGDTLELPLGDFRLIVTAESHARFAPARVRAPRGVAHVAIAAAAHVLALALAAQAASETSAPDAEENRADVLQKLMVSAEQRARAARPTSDDAPGQGRGHDSAPRNGNGGIDGRRAARAEGAMGDSKSTAKGARYAIPERAKEPVSALSRSEALSDAAHFGMIGVVGEDTPSVAPWERFAEVAGRDPLVARGSMWGDDVGFTYGAGGLGLSGIGEGGGGKGEGIGLGSIGSIGVYDLLGGGHRIPRSRRWDHDQYERRDYWPNRGHWRLGRVKCARAKIGSRVPYAGLHHGLWCNAPRIRVCYERALESNPTLAGTITVRFVIGRDGSVIDAAVGASTIDHPELLSCVVGSFKGLSFPQPNDGIVTVTYPISLSPPPPAP